MGIEFLSSELAAELANCFGLRALVVPVLDIDGVPHTILFDQGNQQYGPASSVCFEEENLGSFRERMQAKAQHFFGKHDLLLNPAHTLVLTDRDDSGGLQRAKILFCTESIVASRREMLDFSRMHKYPDQFSDSLKFLLTCVTRVAEETSSSEAMLSEFKALFKADFFTHLLDAWQVQIEKFLSDIDEELIECAARTLRAFGPNFSENTYDKIKNTRLVSLFLECFAPMLLPSKLLAIGIFDEVTSHDQGELFFVRQLAEKAWLGKEDFILLCRLRERLLPAPQAQAAASSKNYLGPGPSIFEKNGLQPGETARRGEPFCTAPSR